MSDLEIWLGSEDSWESYRNRIESLLKLSETQNLRDSYDDEEDNPVGFEVIQNKLAVLSVEGSTVTKSDFLSRYLGIVSYQDIRERLIEAADNPEVKAILLRLDTSGGHAAGVARLSRFIGEVSTNVKPVITYNEGKMASAGLWYGSAGRSVIADEDAQTGSLGVIMVHMDVTKRLENIGVKATVFRTSPYKALNNPYEALTDKAKESILEDMNKMHDSFVNGVALNRGLTAAEVQTKIATGKMYDSLEARELRLVDSILSLDETVARILKGLDNAQAA